MNEEEAELVATVRAFIDREVKPTVRDAEHANEYPEAWIEQMKHIGIFGLAIPEEYYGTPVSMPCYVNVTQELARGWMSLAGAMGGHTVVAKLLILFGTEEQKRKYLPVMATGEMRATMAVSIVVDGINAVQEKREVFAVHRKVAPELAVRESTRTLL